MNKSVQIDKHHAKTDRARAYPFNVYHYLCNCNVSRNKKSLPSGARAFIYASVTYAKKKAFPSGGRWLGVSRVG